MSLKDKPRTCSSFQFSSWNGFQIMYAVYRIYKVKHSPGLPNHEIPSADPFRLSLDNAPPWDRCTTLRLYHEHLTQFSALFGIGVVRIVEITLLFICTIQGCTIFIPSTSCFSMPIRFCQLCRSYLRQFVGCKQIEKYQQTNTIRKQCIYGIGNTRTDLFRKPAPMQGCRPFSAHALAFLQRPD